MATYDEIMVALRNADAAGDTAAATRLAQMAREAKAGAAPAPVQQPQRPITPTPPPERGFGHRIYDNIVGSDDGVQSTGEALGTWLNRAGESMTLGVVGDEASGAVYGALKGTGYEAERDRFRANEAAMSPAARLSADVAGALVPGVGVAGGVARGATLPVKMALGAGAGAAGGGVYGFAEGEGGLDARAANARVSGMMGGAAGMAVPLVGGAIQRLWADHIAKGAVKRAAKAAPSLDDLRAHASALYDQADAVKGLPRADLAAKVPGILDRANREGLDEVLTPEAARVASQIEDAATSPAAGLSFRELDILRKRAGIPAGKTDNKTQQKIAMGLIDGLDAYMDDVAPNLGKTVKEARDTWARMSRAQKVEDAMQAGDTYISGSASGTRNQIASLLRNPKRSAGYSAGEKAALKSISNPSLAEALVHYAGGGLGQTLGTLTGTVLGGAGGVTGNALGAALGAGVGAGARKASEAITRKKADTVMRVIASGELRKPETLAALMQAGIRQRLAAEAAMFGMVPQISMSGR